MASSATSVRQVSQDRRASPDLSDHKEARVRPATTEAMASLGHRDHLVQPGSLDRLASREARDLRVMMAVMGNLGHRDHLVHLEQQGQQEQPARRDNQEHKVLLATTVNKEIPDRQVSRDRQVSQARKASKARARRVLKVTMVIKGTPGHQVPQAQLVLLA
jgi:hypothetical protein